MPPNETSQEIRNPSPFEVLGVGGVFSIIGRYFREKALEQLKSVSFIILYLAAFQIFFLQLPIVYSATIALGIAVVVLGLTFFMEGLRLGLMPFGETIGAILPRNSKLPLIMAFSFILGIGATFAEPAISVLKQAGSGVSPATAPLLYSLLNNFSGQLVASVGVGVGIAVTLGILRFFYGWSLKILIIPIVLLLIGLTLYAYFDPVLRPVIGLAWDCGAVTTGPVTVPLVLALGIGVCRIVGSDNDGAAGFGIVTLASLFPIVAVLGLAIFHHTSGDYYGGENFKGETISPVSNEANEPVAEENSTAEEPLRFTPEEFIEYQTSGELSGFTTRYEGGEAELDEKGRIVLKNAQIVLVKRDDKGMIENFVIRQTKNPWNPHLEIPKATIASLKMAGQAILPLCAFLFLTLLVVLRERLRKADEIALGVLFAVFGMALFGLGLTMGLIPLGTQLGANVPITFASITPWGLSGTVSPLFESALFGKVITILFAFFLGYGATLAEPALNALGQTVDDVTVGVFKKKLLMQVVAVGVGMGIAAGVAQMAFESLNLTWMLIPPYLLLLALTFLSTEEFVNFAWDSAGVTTGPITVPLVLAMGLGIGANIPGVGDGFGILALASVGPIMTVLIVGLIVNRARKEEFNPESDHGV
ncbi:DUF1538 domain-containing protein [Verrucomicrobiales bacterium BCK34]|nr:DUF1538 domain-containing protein [Verrucomicrobiales bacterium BCK34]